EGVQIKDENQTLATITLQNYFRLYDKLGGMTGTAITEANEFHQIYKLGVVPIPTNRPMIRNDVSDVVYQTQDAKFEACVEDIAERHRHGQPVLVGTVSVEKSETLSQLLKRRGVAHEVLNAKYHEREATIVAQAGRKGAVTVATNMAGRGTDIMLGGNPDFIADLELHQRGLSPLETPEDYEAAWPEAVAKAKRAVAEEHEDVVAAGGLYVLGTERHESRRIDNQLRGRSGRQGDPGETRFYLSLEDDLMRMFNSDRVAAIMDRLNIPPDVPVESKVVTRAIRSAQTQVEQQNFEIRKDVLKYDDVLNRQRKVIYNERHSVLEGADLQDQVLKMTDEVIESYVSGATTEGFPEDWDLNKLWRAFKQLFPITVTVEELEDDAQGKANLTADAITDVVIEDAHAVYERREQELTPEIMREFERRVVLSVLDRKWREHLYEMDYLREGIGLRAMAQRDPLIEYQREGFDMFNAMMDGIKEESVGALFNLQVEVQHNPVTDETVEGADGASGPTVVAGGIQMSAGPEVTSTPQAGAQPASPPAPSAPPEEFTETPTRAAGRSANGGRSGSARSGAARSGGGRHRSGATGPQPAVSGGTSLPAGLAPHRSPSLQYTAPSVDGGTHVETHVEGNPAGGNFATANRNDPCPCGSGRKFKRCHGDPRNRETV
ncbi:MAG TPA: SEC-C metal-binding domain-containing protein, partial [Streptosporangiaceae bacterium]